MHTDTHPIVIGEPGKIVEMDKSKFGKQKYKGVVWYMGTEFLGNLEGIKECVLGCCT